MYPTPENIQNGGANLIPESLSSFLESIIVEPKKTSESKKKARVKALAIANAIAEAAFPNTIIAPIPFAVSVYLHRKFASREAIDIFSALGFCSTYTEVINFEKSSVFSHSITYGPDAVVQFGFDNADINIETVDGKDTFHVLGGLEMVCPKDAVKVDVVPRLKQNEKKQLVGEFGTIPIIAHEEKTSGQVSCWFDSNLRQNLTRYSDIWLALAPCCLFRAVNFCLLNYRVATL